MSMVVKNNMSAVHTLNTLNQNSSALTKSLAKVSSGMKINSAQDDASAYAISESMRVRIRSLDQANQNTQNANSLVKTAEGAVATTLEIVRTMKEKAINAATDTNTDQDRLTIQKEMDQFIDQVDDNALVTFNGKILLDGSTMPMHANDYTKEQNIVRGLNSAWLSDALNLINDSYGLNFSDGKGAKYLDVKFVDGSGMSTGTGSVAECGLSSSDTIEIKFNMDIIDKLETTGQDGQDGKFKLPDPKGYNEQTLDRVIAHELTHGVMQSRFGAATFNSLPSYIIEGGSAELVHGADGRVNNTVKGYFASSTDVDNVLNASGTGSAVSDQAYGGGFVVMRYFASVANIDGTTAMKNFMKALDEGGTVDDAFNMGSGGKWTSRADFEKSLKDAVDSFNDGDKFLNSIGINTTNADTGAITGSDAGGRTSLNASNIVHEVGSTVNWRLPSSTSTLIGGLEVRWPEGMSASNGGGGSMVFHVGASANDAINIGFNDMSARGIGLYEPDDKGVQQKLDITTQGKARNAISTLDKIVNLVVDQQTNIGAMLQRLEYTSSNLTVSSENTQAAESTIRDADMAKEMTNYTKNNVLMQAAQSMLAQANQSSSAVLGLLQ